MTVKHDLPLALRPLRWLAHELRVKDAPVGRPAAIYVNGQPVGKRGRSPDGS